MSIFHGNGRGLVLIGTVGSEKSLSHTDRKRDIPTSSPVFLWCPLVVVDDSWKKFSALEGVHFNIHTWKYLNIRNGYFTPITTVKVHKTSFVQVIQVIQVFQTICWLYSQFFQVICKQCWLYRKAICEFSLVSGRALNVIIGRIILHAR